MGVICDCRRYIDDEIQARDIDSPFRVDGAIMGLFNALLTLREEGKGINKMIASVEMLAHANSRRGALASALLPPLHWVMLASPGAAAAQRVPALRLRLFEPCGGEPHHFRSALRHAALHSPGASFLAVCTYPVYEIRRSRL